MRKLGSFSLGVDLVDGSSVSVGRLFTGRSGSLERLHLGLEAAQTEGVVWMLRPDCGLGAHDTIQLETVHLLLELQGLQRKKNIFSDNTKTK